MKINIKDVFEKEEKDIRIHTNDRLDIDEVFAEATADETETEPEKQTDIEDEPEAAAGIALHEEIPEPEAETGQKIEIEPEAETGAEEPETPEESEIGSEEPETPEKPEIPKDSETSTQPEASKQDEASEQPEENPEATDEQAESEAKDKPVELTEGDEQAGPAEDEEAAVTEDTADEPETEHSEENEIPEQPFYKRYLSQGIIAASFLILLAVVMVYTTMIPREVNATINGEEFTFSSKAHTVESFLEEENIEFHEADYISEPLTAFIHDGIEIEINHATAFKVTADGKTKSYKTLANTVGGALKDVGIKSDANDIVTPSLDTMMTKGMEIVVQRVVVREEVVEETVAFETVEKDDSSLDEGKTKVVTEGVDGKDSVTYSITYIDGVESSRKEVSRTTLSAAVDKVVANGTRVNFDGKSYSRKLVVKAYAYTGGGRTAMGTRARVGEIAVDPSVIPLGTNVYIEGVGARRAEDTGGNIKGNTIDIYMDTESQCRNWGVRYVTIYIQ